MYCMTVCDAIVNLLAGASLYALVYNMYCDADISWVMTSQEAKDNPEDFQKAGLSDLKKIQKKMLKNIIYIF